MTAVDIIELIATLITAFGIVFGIYTYYNDLRRKRKQDTMEAYKLLEENTLTKLEQWMPSEIRAATEDKRSDAYKELGRYLAEINRFCIGINQKTYDFNTFYKIAHGHFDSERSTLKPRLLPLLEVKLENAKEDYFSDLHHVWARMDKKSHKA